jgi:hypothetical protein
MAENETSVVQNAQIQAMEDNLYRLLLAREFGQQTYGGDRDYYRILGYKQQIRLRDYHERYERDDIASRIVDLPPQDTWRNPPRVSEKGDTETPFVRAWEALATRVKVWSHMARVDRLAGIGHYGVLMLGIQGGPSDQPLQESYPGPEALRYLRPFAQIHAEIESLNENPNDPRFGMPETYNLTFDNEREMLVHWSRVIHVADNKLDDEVMGVPRLKKVWNRLDDLTKLVGGSAEATWLNMRRGTTFQTREGFKLSGDNDAIEKRQDMIRRYVHDMARVLVLEGLEVSDLGSSTVDPRGAYEVIISQISAATNIPQRVLIGSAQGELAAAEQDTKIWYDHIAARQITWAEPELLRPFIDRLIQHGILPAPSGDYHIGEQNEKGDWQWPSLWQVSEVEAAAIAMNRGQSVAAVRNPVTGTVPATEGELRQILGLPYDVPADESLPAPVPPEPGPGPQAPPDEPDMGDDGGDDVTSNLNTALENYENGEISAAELARYAALQWGHK